VIHLLAFKTKNPEICYFVSTQKRSTTLQLELITLGVRVTKETAIYYKIILIWLFPALTFTAQ